MSRTAATSCCGGAVLQNVAARADFHAFDQIILVVVHRQKQNLGFGTVLLDLPGRLEAAEPGIPMSIRTTSGRTSLPLSTASPPLEASPTTSISFSVGDQRPDSLAEQRVIVRQHDSNLRH